LRRKIEVYNKRRERKTDKENNIRIDMEDGRTKTEDKRGGN